ncbi:MAG: NAD-dependent epimerase/dehydratase family protein [Terriglobia bacterium]|jgi:UDP-glucuronate decarboxylase
MIHWISESLGTAAWDGVDATPGTHILDVRDLLDKEGNSPALLRSKINEGVACLQNGQKVVVCCDYGMSRSNAIAAGILAVHHSVDFESAIRQVIAATGEKAIKIAVLSAVREALGRERHEGTATTAVGRRVLVTGASGFIGSSLMGELRQKHEVTAPTRQEIDLLRDTVTLELLVRERRVDTILHLASPRVSTSNEAMGMSITTLKNVLDVCVENGLFLVYISGWEIYSGYKTKELRANEALAPCPGGTYGQAKLLCETLVRHFHQKYGVAYALLRSSPVYGPRGERPRFIWNFLNKALRNEEIVAHRYLNGFPSLDLLYVDDLCTAIIAVIQRRIQGEFNLGTGKGTSTTEIAQRIVERVGSRSAIRHHDISRYAGNIAMDTTRAVMTLGWHPAVDIAHGLENLISVGLVGQVLPSNISPSDPHGEKSAMWPQADSPAKTL